MVLECGVRMGVIDPEIDCEGWLRWLWWIDEGGVDECGMDWLIMTIN